MPARLLAELHMLRSTAAVLPQRKRMRLIDWWLPSFPDVAAAGKAL
jgi:hypothetical protein